jgi:hypothetical protein
MTNKQSQKRNETACVTLTLTEQQTNILDTIRSESQGIVTSRTIALKAVFNVFELNRNSTKIEIPIKSNQVTPGNAKPAQAEVKPDQAEVKPDQAEVKPDSLIVTTHKYNT